MTASPVSQDEDEASGLCERLSLLSRIFTVGERRPSGLPEYSSYVIYIRYTRAKASTTIAMTVEAFCSTPYVLLM